MQKRHARRSEGPSQGLFLSNDSSGQRRHARKRSCSGTRCFEQYASNNCQRGAQHRLTVAVEATKLVPAPQDATLGVASRALHDDVSAHREDVRAGWCPLQAMSTSEACPYFLSVSIRTMDGNDVVCVVTVYLFNHLPTKRPEDDEEKKERRGNEQLLMPRLLRQHSSSPF